MSSSPSISLATFVANLFFGVAVQDNDQIFKEVYDLDFSRNVQET